MKIGKNIEIDLFELIVITSAIVMIVKIIADVF